jgi:RecB family endonuclease NucS
MPATAMRRRVYESVCEDVLNEDIGVLDPSLMVVGRRVPTAFGKFIDILAVDGEGDLTIVELKRNRTPREVAAKYLTTPLGCALSHTNR